MLLGHRCWCGRALLLFALTDVRYVYRLRSGADPGVEIWGGHMASAEREPIMRVWGLCPQRGPGAEPLVRAQVRPPEAERFLVLSYVWNGAKLLCLWAVLWSLMVAAVPTCARQLSFNFSSMVWGAWPRGPPWIRPWLRCRMDVTFDVLNCK